MTDEAKKIYDALNDVTVMCAECQHYGEPFGCNRRGGSCIAYDFILDAADLIERLSKRVEELESEVEYWEDLAEGRASD